jgi:hypothetical protein
MWGNTQAHDTTYYLAYRPEKLEKFPLTHVCLSPQVDEIIASAIEELQLEMFDPDILTGGIHTDGEGNEPEAAGPSEATDTTGFVTPPGAVGLTCRGFRNSGTGAIAPCTVRGMSTTAPAWTRAASLTCTSVRRP